MRCVANYEIESEISVVADSKRLQIEHPKGAYRVLLKNIPRTEFSTPFLLSLHLYFDSPSLKEARDIAEERLVDCLNMLAFTTGSAFARHRIRQIVDCTPESGMRDVHFWGDAIKYEDPQPFLREDSAKAVERLSEFEVQPAIRRAMRWYRLGIKDTVPADQFQYFWFAIEIIAEFQKSTEKVNDKCPKCQSSLYCEACKTHPKHKPYAKQAIATLLKAVDKDCSDEVLERLDKTRNGLMHGKTLKEIWHGEEEPEKIVDVLGALVFRALVFQFPHEWFDGSIAMGIPSTYLHRRVDAIALMQTIVPKDAEGNFDLSFTGMKMTMETFGPPQSAQPTVIVMTTDQYNHLEKLAFQQGDHQEMCRRIRDRRKQGPDGKVACLVLSTDMARINNALKVGETGAWQDLFREIIGS
jgi:hypothetical protein